MTTTLDDQVDTTDYSARLRELCVGCRLSKARWGVSKVLEKDQKELAAFPFGAVAKSISASKKLIDTASKRYRAVTKVFSQVTEYWESHTLPFPEKSLRLLRREQVEEFEQQIASYQSELDGAVALLQREYGELLSKAQQDLGSLFNVSDYPSTLEGLYSIIVEYPSVEPDPSLVTISASLYQRERQRIAARFDEAVEMAEEAFAAEFQGLVQHLSERLQGLNDGTVKRFSDSNITNLCEFFDRFKSLSIGSNGDLDQLVSEAKDAVKGISPDWLKQSEPLRDSIREKLGTIGQQLDELMVARPKRAISFDDE